MSPDPVPRHTPLVRAMAIAIGLSAIVSVIVLAFSWPTVTSAVRDLPLAIAGPTAQVEQVRDALEDSAPGAFALTEVADRDAAVDGIEDRSVYGAILLGQEPEVLTASAAGPAVSQLLDGIAATLQQRLDAALAAQGVPAKATVTVTDVVPLAGSDPRGVGLTAAAFPLVLGGMLGGILVSILVIGAWRKLLTVVVYSAVGGAALAAILQGWFGSLQGDYWADAGAIALSLLAIGATIVGFSALVGRAGVAIGPVLFLLIANPISAAAQPLEFLPKPWGAVGQWFPPGASATLLRDLSYFPHAPTAFPWLVLGLWSLAGILLGIAGHFRTGVVVESRPVEPRPGAEAESEAAIA